MHVPVAELVVRVAKVSPVITKCWVCESLSTPATGGVARAAERRECRGIKH
jgi:hypothetical protein